MKTKILHCPENGVLEIAVTGELCNEHACDLMQITLGHINSGLATQLVIDLRATRLNHGFSLFNLYRLVENFRHATVCRDVQILILSRGEEKKGGTWNGPPGRQGLICEISAAVLKCANAWAVNLLLRENAERRAPAFLVIIGQVNFFLPWSIIAHPEFLKSSWRQFFLAVLCASTGCILLSLFCDPTFPVEIYVENFEYCLCPGGQYIILPKLLCFALKATALVLPEDPEVLEG